jgi:hypothetical protein
MSSRRGLVQRQVAFRDQRLFVIATEGEKTEKQYFSVFESSRIKVEVLETGLDRMSAPKHVLSRPHGYVSRYNLDYDDELWPVSDTDRQRPQQSML